MTDDDIVGIRMTTPGDIKAFARAIEKKVREEMNTCKDCRYFQADSMYIGFGECDKMDDANHFAFHPKDRSAELDKCYGWDYEGYSAGTYVGESFGCIHWEKK